jgi:hypothetical protein
MTLKININIRSLPNEIEKFIIKKFNKNILKLYAKIQDDELNMIKSMTKNRFSNESFLISDELIKSIRSSFVRNHMIKKHFNLKNNIDKIIKNYKEGIDILKLTSKYDISPLNILREIFYKKYGMKLSKLILKPDLLDAYDYSQLKIAIDNDEYALIDNSKILKESINFEKKIEEFLKDNSIKYVTQEELAKEQLKKYGRIINTPDFLIKSDFFINDRKINWIDAKNFYGTKIPFIKDKIKKQTLKYLNKWGPGCIVFNYGFNENLKFTNILFLDYFSLINKK